MFVLAVVVLDAVLVAALVGTVLPLAVGLLTKINASAGVKGVLLLTLSAVNGLVSTATQTDGTALISKETLVAALASWAAAVTTHFGLWKPAQAQEKALLPDRGIGPAAPPSA